MTSGKTAGGEGEGLRDGDVLLRFLEIPDIFHLFSALGWNEFFSARIPLVQVGKDPMNPNSPHSFAGNPNALGTQDFYAANFGTCQVTQS